MMVLVIFECFIENDFFTMRKYAENDFLPMQTAYFSRAHACSGLYATILLFGERAINSNCSPFD